MKQILLAINGPDYRREAVRYALGLARRLKAQLAVLQVLGPGRDEASGLGAALRKGARELQETMAEAAYAEAGEHETAVRLRRDLDLAARSLAEAEGGSDRVAYRITVRSGEMRDEVTRFVGDHPEAVLAVYDGPAGLPGADHPDPVRAELPIPVVSLEKKRRSRGDDMSEVEVKKKSRTARAAEKFEKYNEAVAYAEEDMHEEAVRILDQMDEAPSTLLVLGRGHGFSEALLDYSVGLARRLGYDIVAVNNKYIPKDFLPLVTQYREKLREDFSRLSAQAAEEFKNRCDEAGIRFRHVVKFGESTDVLRELHHEFGNLDYVVSEPDEEVRGAPGVRPAIPVFSLKFA